ncbi:hypothetical protein TD95_004793 [Thielaviopsis punctulata]|uniref:Glutamyl-tRNA amidotransferase complex subunit Gta3 domain-containing protein n=1 Tax=Thielaviopsis punctulata TaxID=72032 RepID=A0A0F4ZE26_9PEZI|nr:hypothetical protein TD95_004793 [Thielaviopsis punctulata]
MALQTTRPLLSPLAALLATPSWSVSTLLSRASATPPTVTPAQLHHLLRLSALPLPATRAEEAAMLDVLHAQLGFVRDVQAAESAKRVEPLRAIRDETPSARREAEIGVSQVQHLLAQESERGYLKRRVRQRDTSPPLSDAENWDKLAMASKKTDKYFVVQSSSESVE